MLIIFRLVPLKEERKGVVAGRRWAQEKDTPRKRKHKRDEAMPPEQRKSDGRRNLPPPLPHRPPLWEIVKPSGRPGPITNKTVRPQDYDEVRRKLEEMA